MKLNKLRTKAVRVVMAAQDAQLSMPEEKIVRMEMADLEALRLLGAAVSELNEVLQECE